VTTLLYALGLDCARKSWRPSTKEDDRDFYKRGAGHGWKMPFDAERMRGVKPLRPGRRQDRRGRAEAGQKLTRAQAAQGRKDGLTELLVADEEIFGRYLAEDLVNEEDRRDLHRGRRRDRPRKPSARSARQGGHRRDRTARHRPRQRRPYIRNTLRSTRTENREDALIDIYRVMRPGEPPTSNRRSAVQRACSSIRAL
jgi:DNA-directed RNA polymerase subunit beta